MEDISLEELSKRHPGVEEDVNQVIFETSPKPSTPPSGGKKRPLLSVVRDITLGMFVVFTSLWFIHYFPMLFP